MPKKKRSKIAKVLTRVRRLKVAQDKLNAERAKIIRDLELTPDEIAKLKPAPKKRSKKSKKG